MDLWIWRAGGRPAANSNLYVDMTLNRAGAHKGPHLSEKWLIDLPKDAIEERIPAEQCDVYEKENAV
ncbi:hypothetical protein L596_001789 [Steinernema carpocapsae]|uniref:Uncharacterized protein n=1 Tax=Steinernema carpocapsae TaxID=34508 RepID=A0A4U8UNB2_STECR|nr:hypothetical protein L596_001789 [Steinernema carpocapsae]